MLKATPATGPELDLALSAVAANEDWRKPMPAEKRPQFWSYCIGDLAFPDLQEYLKVCDMIMIPMASLEQHGPHLPLYTDTITALEVAKRTAEQARVLYTPPVWMGYSPQHMRSPGGGTGTITV